MGSIFKIKNEYYNMRSMICKRFIIVILTLLAVVLISGCQPQESSVSGREGEDSDQYNIAFMEISGESKDMIEAFFPYDSMYGLYRYSLPEDASVLSIKHLLYKDGKLQNEDTLINIDLIKENEFRQGTVSIFQTQQKTYNVVCNTGKQSITINSVKFVQGSDEMVSACGPVLDQEDAVKGKEFVLYAQYLYHEGEEISLADVADLRELDGIYDLDLIELSFS